MRQTRKFYDNRKSDARLDIETYPTDGFETLLDRFIIVTYDHLSDHVANIVWATQSCQQYRARVNGYTGFTMHVFV